MTSNKLTFAEEFLVIYVAPLSPRRGTINPCYLGMSPGDIITNSTGWQEAGKGPDNRQTQKHSSG